MAKREMELRETGRTVANNVERLRRSRRMPDGRSMTQRDLSDEMAKTVGKMAHNTISEIERGARRCDVDDLMMLAEALNVSPLALLMPTTTLDGEPVVTGHELVQATGRSIERAEVLWREGLLAELPNFGDTTAATIQGTAAYRRCRDSSPSFAVKARLSKVSDGND